MHENNVRTLADEDVSSPAQLKTIIIWLYSGLIEKTTIINNTNRILPDSTCATEGWSIGDGGDCKRLRLRCVDDTQVNTAVIDSGDQQQPAGQRRDSVESMYVTHTHRPRRRWRCHTRYIIEYIECTWHRWAAHVATRD